MQVTMNIVNVKVLISAVLLLNTGSCHGAEYVMQLSVRPQTIIEIHDNESSKYNDANSSWSGLPTES
jgi:hypothetical protein